LQSLLGFAFMAGMVDFHQSQFQYQPQAAAPGYAQPVYHHALGPQGMAPQLLGPHRMVAQGAALPGAMPQGLVPQGFAPQSAAQPAQYVSNSLGHHMGCDAGPGVGTAPQTNGLSQQEALQSQPSQEEERLVEVQAEFTVTLTVPDNATPGTKLQYKAPDGQELRLTVPEGVPPGSIMSLTQDPVSKQWKCMAEPADPPPEQQRHEQPVMQAQAMAPGPCSSMPSAAMASHLHMRQAFPSPVNLSYVPPPVMGVHPQGSTSILPGPGQMDSSRFNPPRAYLPGPPSIDQHPSYTPPIMMEQRPSYIPMPEVLPVMQPGPLMGQTASYVPPPMHVVQQQQQQSPSYVPPVAMPMTGPSLDGPGPSINTLPQPGHAFGPGTQPPVGCGVPCFAPLHQVSPGHPGNNFGGMPPMAAAMPQIGLGPCPFGSLPQLGQQLLQFQQGSGCGHRPPAMGCYPGMGPGGVMGQPNLGGGMMPGMGPEAMPVPGVHPGSHPTLPQPAQGGPPF